MWIFEKALRRMVRTGRLTLVYHDGKIREFGVATPDRPHMTIRLHDRRVPMAIVRDPRLGLAEAYMDGRVTIEGGDIMDFVTFMRHDHPWEWTGDRPRKDKGRHALARRTVSLTGWLIKANDRRRSRANVAHHYDLSGALYDLFLDKDRQYSCAYWPEASGGGITLEQAQEDKKAHIAAKLALKPGQRVLDIGCGWGGMALYLHRTCGVDVTGITLSEEQLKVARARAREAGVQQHVRFELIDYRDMTGPFDRIVSVGMFEHVGTPHYAEFFRLCHNLLAPDGVMLLHTIGRMGPPGRTDAFTDKYIFPGGYIPALSEIVRSSEANKLMITDLETLRLHYALTLREWYKRTVAHRAEIEAMYDPRFYRMWTFYLAGATAAFETGGMVNYQIQFSRNRHALPITRDYMHQAEAALRGA
ncbi:cyclopropane-fatty-acyl-phospholipid synthase family protein [Sphingobium sp. AN641]|uniref:cyclopropane-fatty-acyl-phospholipid synthase family protein n=1 Tax=Sphingobium sp. AN641 TaxID=3133443 RepID=UPI0030C1F4DA